VESLQKFRVASSVPVPAKDTVPALPFEAFLEMVIVSLTTPTTIGSKLT
jgi:hypothetical protein